MSTKLSTLIARETPPKWADHVRTWELPVSTLREWRRLARELEARVRELDALDAAEAKVRTAQMREFDSETALAKCVSDLEIAEARAALAEAQARVMADKLAQCYHGEFEQAPYCPHGDPYECGKGLADKFVDGGWSPPEPECVECWAAWSAREAGGDDD